MKSSSHSTTIWFVPKRPLGRAVFSSLAEILIGEIQNKGDMKILNLICLVVSTPLKNIHNLSFQGFFCSMTAGWWYTYPSEKWWSESRLGWWHSQYMESHKTHVSNHQTVIQSLHWRMFHEFSSSSQLLGRLVGCFMPPENLHLSMALKLGSSIGASLWEPGWLP